MTPCKLFVERKLFGNIALKSRDLGIQTMSQTKMYLLNSLLTKFECSYQFYSKAISTKVDPQKVSKIFVKRLLAQ